MDRVILEKEALKLPEVQRALLADRLIESLSPLSKNLQTAWIREADDRMTAFRDGRIEAIEGPKAIADLRARFAR